MLKQTVYIETTDFIHSKYHVQYRLEEGAYAHVSEPKEGYFLTEEQLRELIGKVWEDAGMTTLKGVQAGFLNKEMQSKFKLSDRELIQGIGETIVNYPIPDNDNYIKELLK